MLGTALNHTQPTLSLLEDPAQIHLDLVQRWRVPVRLAVCTARLSNSLCPCDLWMDIAHARISGSCRVDYC